MKEKNLKQKNLTSNIQPLKASKGITLIALVITIIVMLILVAVTISMAINGGLFNYAGKAVGETGNAINKEQDLGNGRINVENTWYNNIDDYLNNIPSSNQGGDTPVVPEDKGTYDETEKDMDNNGVLKANATFKSDGYTAVIPKGFKIVPGIGKTQSIAEGLVIEDKDGNQFVWIPVTGYTKDGEKDEHELYDSFKEVFKRKYSSRGLEEPYSQGYKTPEGKTEADEYYEMMLSVQENGGFYIGRFEAGSTAERTDRAEGNETTTMVVKQNQYPYSFVCWGSSMTNYTDPVTYDGKKQGKGAVLLCKEMYQGKDVGVKSCLCYCVQWDNMLSFIAKDSTYNVTGDCKSWGNFEDNAWKIKNQNASYYMSSSDTWTKFPTEEKSKTSSQSLLLTTGASDTFAAKNIYDVAGNCWEWTMGATTAGYRGCLGRSLLPRWI